MRLLHCQVIRRGFALDRTHRRQPSEFLFVRRGRALGQRELDDVFAAEPRDQLPRRAQRDDLPLIDHGDAVAQPFGFVHVVRREHHRAARLAEAVNHFPELPPRLRIEAGRRLVEKKELRIAYDRTGHRQPLLLPAGELAPPRLFALSSSDTRRIASSGSIPVR